MFFLLFQLRVPLKVTFNVKSRDIDIQIQKKHLKVGLKGHPPIIDGELYNEIKLEESTWVLEDSKSLLINLEKVSKYCGINFWLWDLFTAGIAQPEIFESKLSQLFAS